MITPDAAPPSSANDAVLSAYLDGELSPADAAQVEARLHSDTAARVQLMSLTVQRNALADRFALPLNCPITKALVAKVLDG